MKRPSNPLLLATGALCLVALAACSSTSPAGSSGSPSASQPQSLTAEQVTVENPASTPTLQFPVPSVATTLSIRDLAPGSGPAAKPTDTVKAEYVGEGATTGVQFDSSYEHGQPIEFPLTRVIPGWTQGITGMKAGGERILVIPGSLAYGPNPQPGSGIMPNETLVFYVKLVSISTRPVP